MEIVNNILVVVELAVAALLWDDAEMLELCPVGFIE